MIYTGCREQPRSKKMIKNINADFGDAIEFEDTAEMVAAIESMGYAIPADGLKEGRDYEEIFDIIEVTADDGSSQIFSCSDVKLPSGRYNRLEWIAALESVGYTQITPDMIE